jgi:hypothetical protein
MFDFSGRAEDKQAYILSSTITLEGVKATDFDRRL